MTHQESFAASLHDAALLLDQLHELLQDERQSLTASDAQKTQSLLQQKTQLLQQLDQNNRQRSELLTTRGFATDEEGVQAFLASFPPQESQAYSVQWQSLQQKLEQCKEENLINGKVIHRSRRQVDTLLNMLRGRENNHRIYTGSGEAKPVHSGRPLAKA